MSLMTLKQKGGIFDPSTMIEGAEDVERQQISPQNPPFPGAPRLGFGVPFAFSTVPNRSHQSTPSAPLKSTLKSPIKSIERSSTISPSKGKGKGVSKTIANPVTLVPGTQGSLESDASSKKQSKGKVGQNLASSPYARPANSLSPKERIACSRAGSATAAAAAPSTSRPIVIDSDSKMCSDAEGPPSKARPTSSQRSHSEVEESVIQDGRELPAVSSPAKAGKAHSTRHQSLVPRGFSPVITYSNNGTDNGKESRKRKAKVLVAATASEATTPTPDGPALDTQDQDTLEVESSQPGEAILTLHTQPNAGSFEFPDLSPASLGKRKRKAVDVAASSYESGNEEDNRRNKVAKRMHPAEAKAPLLRRKQGKGIRSLLQSAKFESRLPNHRHV